MLQSQTTHEVARRVRIEFHDAGEGEVDWRSAFQVRSAYRHESDFRIEHLRATRPEDAGPHLARIIDTDASVSKNYERMAWKRMQDLDRDAPGELTIGEYRRKSLGDLQRALCGLFSDPSLSLQDFGGIQTSSFRFSKGDVTDFHYKNLSGGEKAAFDVLLDVFLKRDEAKEAVFCIDRTGTACGDGSSGTTDRVGPLAASGDVAVVDRDAFDRSRQASTQDAAGPTWGSRVSELFGQGLRWLGHHNAQYSQ